MMTSINQQIVVITGGATGIGFALVKYFVQANMVISIDRNPDKIESLKKQLPEIISIRADICKLNELDYAVNEIEEKFGKIDLFINSAGVGHFYNFLSLPESEIINLVTTEITTDLTAPILLTKKILPLLSKSETPKIVYITTGLVYMPDVSSPTYCPSKVGLHFFAMSLRHQLEHTKIKVIEVLPAAVDTEFSKDIDVPKISTEKFVKTFIKKLESGQTTIRIGMANVLHILSRFFPKLAFKIINRKK